MKPDTQIYDTFFAACAQTVCRVRNDYVRDRGREPEMLALMTEEAQRYLYLSTHMTRIYSCGGLAGAENTLCGCRVIVVRGLDANCAAFALRVVGEKMPSKIPFA